jgi:hypothetical protein
MHQAALTHTFVQYLVPIDFSGKVVLDGNVEANDEGVVKLSEILPDPADRTFTFAGRVQDSTVIDTKTNIYDQQLTPAQCGQSTGVTPIAPRKKRRS